MTDSTPITLNQIRALQEGAVTLCLNDHEWLAELSEFEALPKHDPLAERTPFSFCITVSESGLPQGTYRLRHSSLKEALTLFLVPVAGDGSFTKFQAVFN